MPELPEVENVRQGLSIQVEGRTITHVDVLWANIIKDPSVEEFKKQLENQTIHQVGRRGKFLLFYLTDYTLISHLRMEGKYTLVPTPSDFQLHTHIVFHLDNGEDMRYMDVRKFGRMSLVEKGQEENHPSLSKLGPEPVREEFKIDAMTARLQKHKKAIKAVLLDQSMVVGIGNIYADEILFEAGILPTRPSDSLTNQERKKLYEAIIDIMNRAVELGGTTVRSYKNSFGEEGTYQKYLRVYGKNKKECPRCHQTIQKAKVAQRGTHFCLGCQK